jgi:phosphotransferase system IIA component
MKKIISIIIVILIVVGAGLLLKKKASENAQMTPAQNFGVVVQTVMPKKESVVLTTPILAMVKNDHDITLSSKFAANVEKIVPAGTVVKKGDLLVELDARDLLAKKSALQTALMAFKEEERAKKISLLHEEEAHQRTLELLHVKAASIEQSDGEISKIELLKADLSGVTSKQQQVKSDLEQTDILIGYAKLKSPIDGIVGQVLTTQGEMATLGKPLLALKASSGSYLWVKTPLETKAKSLIYDGVKTPLVFLQNNNGLNEYRADMSLNLPSGARIEAKLVSFEGEGILLPKEAILQKDHQSFYLSAEGTKAVAKEVTIIAQGDEGFVVNDVPEAKIVVAKPDILLKLLGSNSIIIKE